MLTIEPSFVTEAASRLQHCLARNFIRRFASRPGVLSNSATELSTGPIGVMVGAVNAFPKWISEIMQHRSGWIMTYLFFVIVMGGFMGFLGAAVAEAFHYPQWSNVLSGALGASGAFGFEFLIKPALPLPKS